MCSKTCQYSVCSKHGIVFDAFVSVMSHQLIYIIHLIQPTAVRPCPFTVTGTVQGRLLERTALTFICFQQKSLSSKERQKTALYKWQCSLRIFYYSESFCYHHYKGTLRDRKIKYQKNGSMGANSTFTSIGRLSWCYTCSCVVLDSSLFQQHIRK